MRSADRGALALLVLALVVRLGFLLHSRHFPLSSDAKDYDRIGQAIAAGHLYAGNALIPSHPSAYRPPLYPYLLGAIYFVIGHHPLVARAVGSLLGVVSVALVGVIARQLWGRRLALVAIGIAAVFPAMMIISTALMSEALFVPLILAATACALQARTSTRPVRWLAASAVLVGLATLTRTTGLVLIIPLAIAAWISAKSNRAVLHAARVLLVIGLTALTLVPWAVRNSVTFHRFTPLTTETWTTLGCTYNDFSLNLRIAPAACGHQLFQGRAEALAFLRTNRNGGEPALEARYRSKVIHFIERHPAYPLYVAWRNTLRLLGLSGDPLPATDADEPHEHGIGTWGLAVLLPFVAIGAFGAAARRAPAWFWLCPLLLFVSVIFVEGYLRGRAPLDPFLVLVGALGASSAWSYARSRSRAGPKRHAVRATPR